jgi:uncharacterized membrane protein
MTPAHALQRRPDGFFERGHQVTRLESFVDASFAFAVTLLVISVNELPDNPESLVTALKRIPAFAGSFAAIAMFWYQHNVWSRRFGLDDTRSIVLSLVLVFMVLVYVYPLRILFAAFFAWISSGFFPSDFRIRSLDDLKTMFSVYALAFGSLGIVMAAHDMNALRLRAKIGLDALEEILLQREVLASFFMPLAAVVSLLVVAALDESWPNWSNGMPGMVYCLMGLTGLAHRYRAAEVRELKAALAPAH